MKKETLVDKVYITIKEDIISGKINAGEMISENGVANRLGISRTPVSSAFQRLAMEGFIKIYQSRGAIVQEMSIVDMMNLYDLRIAIEPFVLRKAFDLITSKDIKNLRDIIVSQEQMLELGEYTKSMEYDIQFHLYFLKIYKNEKIREIMETSTQRIVISGYRALIKPGRNKATIEEHNNIVDTLEKEDLVNSVKYLEKHLINGANSILVRI